MKAATISIIKKELQHYSQNELVDMCLKLASFKIENKELLSYLLFEAHNETAYIESIKTYIDVQFELINTKSYFYIRKSVRKILSQTKKYIKYSKNKETEIELLLYFCSKLKHFKPSIQKSKQLTNTYLRQLALAKNIISTFHEDLQYDYDIMLENLAL